MQKQSDLEIPIRIYTTNTKEVIDKLFDGDSSKPLEFEGGSIKFNTLRAEADFDPELIGVIVAISLNVIQGVSTNLISNIINSRLGKLKLGFKIGNQKTTLDDFQKTLDDYMKSKND